MNKLKQLPVGKQVLLAFGMLCAILVAIGVLFFFSLRSIERDNQAQQESLLHEMGIVHDIIRNVGLMQAEVLLHVLATDIEEMKRRDQIIRDLKDENAKKLGDYKALIDRESETRLYDTVLATRKVYSERTEELLTLSRANRNAEAEEFAVSQQAPPYGAYQRALNDLTANAQEKGQTFAAATTRLISTVRTTGNILIGFAIVIALGTGLAVLKVTRQLTVDNTTLQTEIAGRKRTEEALQERARLAALEAEVGTALARGGALAEVLRLCCDAIVRRLDAAFARIWTLYEKENVLELQSSAGMYTHLNGPHSRVPVGALKIGLIASERQPHLTNQVVGDPRVSDQDWAKREGMVAFAGYPLLVEDRLVGVVAMFARHQLSEVTLQALASIANNIALGIEHRRAEKSLRESEGRLHHLVSSNPAVIYSLKFENGALVPTWISENITQLTGHKPEEIFTPNWWADHLHPGDRERVQGEHAAPFPSDRLLTEYRFQRNDGNYVWVRDEKTLLRDTAGKPVEVVGSWTDISGRRSAEEALRESEEKLRQLAENVADVFWMASPDLRQIHYVSPAYAKIWGRSVESLYANPQQWAEAILPEERERVFATFAKLAAEGPSASAEYRIERPDGTVRWIHSRGFQVQNAAGKVIRITGIASDISERKHVEEHLLQSQKMEMVGKLAGGVAHEFNSIMTAIIGQSELLLGDLETGSSLRKNAQEIRQAADRAATLTRQLLAYGRKQILQPTILDLNSVVADVEGMLRLLMGGDVDVRVVRAAGLKPVKADARQIEQVIMSIAMNAADAMPNGGKLTLETANVTLDEEYVRHFPDLKAGDYVMLAASDTGAGMTDEIKARLFEPFFSTKGVGKGTGLGLAACQGIIKQSSGHIAAYSEPGQGATFKVYLPQAEQQTKASPPPRESSDLPHGTETILLVEDDPALREMAATLLRRLGYTALTAANGVEALTLTHQEDTGHIDLLFTDVVMPQMSGKELSDRIHALHPNTKILFTSAFTENAIVHQGVLNEGVTLLQKPFTPSALALKVREVLNGSNKN